MIDLAHEQLAFVQVALTLLERQLGVGDVVADATGADDPAVRVTDQEPAVVDPAPRPIGAQHAVAHVDPLPGRRLGQCRDQALAIVGMDRCQEGDPAREHLLRRAAPDLAEGRAEILQPADPVVPDP